MLDRAHAASHLAHVPVRALLDHLLLVQDPLAMAYNFDAAASDRINCGNGPTIDNIERGLAIFVVYPVSTSGSRLAAKGSYAGAGNGGALRFRLSDAASGDIGFLVGPDAGGSPTECISTGSAFVASRWQVFGFQWDVNGANTDQYVYQCLLGRKLAEVSGYATRLVGTSKQSDVGVDWIIGNRTNFDTAFNGYVALAILARVDFTCTPAQIERVLYDPFDPGGGIRCAALHLPGFFGEGIQPDLIGDRHGVVTGATPVPGPGATDVVGWRDRVLFGEDIPPAPAAGVAVGLALEGDVAQPVTRAKLRAVGVATEDDLALAVTRAKLRSVGLATEDDLALTLTWSKLRGVGLALEDDLALAVSRAKLRAVGLATEDDLALALTWSKLRSVGLALEDDVALAVARAKLRSVGLATEDDLAFPVAVGGATPVGLALEDDLALALTWSKLRSVGLALEDDLALSVTPATGVPVGVAFEDDLALALTWSKLRSVGLALEDDLALAVTRRRTYPLGLALEDDLAFPVAAVAVIPVGLVVEGDLAFALTWTKARPTGLALEADLALALLVVTPPKIIYGGLAGGVATIGGGVTAGVAIFGGGVKAPEPS